MKRLIDRGLMFGNLILVDSPVLIERYNRALQGLVGRTTGLSEFHIDISGFSPEVGDELNNPLYLNPNGCNRQFIILTIEQKKAPLLDAKFSTSRGILRQFIAQNEANIFALSAHDAIAGELLNSVFDVSDPIKLFDIHKIQVEADTTQSHVKNARLLAEKIDIFQTEPEAWFDDDLIASMIELAQETGDATGAPIVIDEFEYVQANFWTSHFDGMYIFRDVKFPTALISSHIHNANELPIDRVVELGDRDRIAKFLQKNDLVEPLVNANGIDGAQILRQKMEFILVNEAAERGMELGDMSPRRLRQVAQRLGSDLPEAYQGLSALVRWTEDDRKWPRIDSRHPAYFYSFRARPDHPDRDLINRLLAEFTQKDFRQLFICHKEKFYSAYKRWPDQKREYVAKFLHRDYVKNKASVREKLFSSKPAFHTVPTSGRQRKRMNMIEHVGPWGALNTVRRR